MKKIEDLDVLTLPPRSERGYIDESIGEELEIEGTETLTRVMLKEEKKEKEKSARRRFRLTRILLCIFLPIPLMFILYWVRPDLFMIFSREARQSNAFDTVQIQRPEQETAILPEVEIPPQPDPDPEVEAPVVNYIIHIVQADETLFTISQDHFGSREGEVKIREFNNLESVVLEVGQQLKIPTE